ncbi:methenyltetrahydrofolate synthase domain-containing protein isoform X4 [Scyliorhinus canicula]|uniref:methenyltetrahydrofolate synthase domain-containing protein isoform X4 n=1 Tax=Scyliorhinus canicula TaxID=7830 RepID=UPI0018F5C05A|nr:methenyltetrahydrofolate synthase domain-containing protein isoform X4 [Scyliorhinus canicula]
MQPAIKLMPGASKWDIRQKVWDYMEENNLANFPRPVHHRIPNFKGVKDFSVPVGLDAKVHVDLVVVGSVAVSDKGWRIGKGEGFADLEYAMMVSMGAVDENTVVVTTVHDCQLLDIPEELMDNHDLTVDYILTPTQVIRTECKRSKPQGIIWSKVDSEMMERMPILKSLRFREKKAGKDVTLRDEGPAEKKELPRLSHFRKPPWKGGSATQMRTNSTEVTKSSDASEEQIEPGSKMRLNASVRMTTVYMGNIPHSLRVSELKNILRDHNALPLRLNWQGAQHRAFLDYKDEVIAEEAVTSLAGLSISGSVIRVELAKSQTGNRSRSQTTENTSNQPLV